MAIRKPALPRLRCRWEWRFEATGGEGSFLSDEARRQPPRRIASAVAGLASDPGLGGFSPGRLGYMEFLPTKTFPGAFRFDPVPDSVFGIPVEQEKPWGMVACRADFSFSFKPEFLRGADAYEFYRGAVSVPEMKCMSRQTYWMEASPMEERDLKQQCTLTLVPESEPPIGRLRPIWSDPEGTVRRAEWKPGFAAVLDLSADTSFAQAEGIAFLLCGTPESFRDFLGAAAADGFFFDSENAGAAMEILKGDRKEDEILQ